MSSPFHKDIEGSEMTEAEFGLINDFAAWLTTRPTVIKVGAPETVYAMFEALNEYREMKGMGFEMTPDPSQAFSDWMEKGPPLAKAAGLYVGITVTAPKSAS